MADTAAVSATDAINIDDIEEVAAKTPEKILKLPIDTRYGLQPYQASRLGFFLFDDPKKVRAAANIPCRRCATPISRA